MGLLAEEAEVRGSDAFSFGITMCSYDFVSGKNGNSVAVGCIGSHALHKGADTFGPSAAGNSKIIKKSERGLEETTAVRADTECDRLKWPQDFLDRGRCACSS
jgi:hypothetical protein